MSHKFVTGFNCLVMAVTAACSFSAVADSAQELKAKLAGIDNLQANFSQSVTDINNKLIQQGSGVFALAYPNKFYWHLTEPDESLIVADGKDVWIYNPFAEEVTALDIDDAIKASPITLLVNRDEATWSQYDVVATDNCYDIKPKIADGQVTEVTVCFLNDTISGFRLADEQGNVSKFALSDQVQIETSHQSLFEFELPEGVDLDDQRIAKP